MGIVIYELLFGKRPFRGRTSKEIASRICKSALTFPSTRELSDACYDFIAKVRISEQSHSLVVIKEESCGASWLWVKRGAEHHGASMARQHRLEPRSQEEA